jgi:hypothetical protein
MFEIGCSLLAPSDAHFLGGGASTGGGGGGGSGGSGGEPACDPAPPCSETISGPTVNVTLSQVNELAALVANAAPNTTLVLESGTYLLTAVLTINTEGITIRSASGVASDVVLDGNAAPVIIAIGAPNVTLRDITVKNAFDSAVLIGSGAGKTVERARLCGVEIIDGGNYFIQSSVDNGWADCGRLERTRLRLSDDLRIATCARGFVVGLTIQGGRRWWVTESEFNDFYCSTTLPVVSAADCGAIAPTTGAIFNLGARETVIERSRFTNAMRAIAFGYTVTTTAPRAWEDDPFPNMTIEHYDGLLRNNVIVGHPKCFDTGIELNHARRPSVLHNTVVYTDEIAFAAIDRRYPSTSVEMVNNLVRGLISFRDGAEEVTDQSTVIVDDLNAVFVSPSTGDFHLLPSASVAIDKGVTNELAGLDMDGEPHDRGSAPDVGADEAAP